MDPAGAEAASEHATKVCETMAPWAGERQYFNFLERPGSRVADCYEADTYERLLELRAKFDPDGMFQANHVLV